MWNSINHSTHESLGAFVSKENYNILFQTQEVFGHAVIVWALYVESGSSANIVS